MYCLSRLPIILAKVMKNKEIEIQLKIISRKEFIKTIESLGFNITSRNSIEDIYYSVSGRFSDDLPYFRIRNQNNKYELTYKKNLINGQIKTRKEIILNVDSLKNAVEFLEAIELRHVVTKKMNLLRYEVGTNMIEIIKTTSPTQFEFAEIESRNKRDLDKIFKKINNYVQPISEKDFPKI